MLVYQRVIPHKSTPKSWWPLHVHLWDSTWDNYWTAIRAPIFSTGAGVQSADVLAWCVWKMSTFRPAKLYVLTLRSFQKKTALLTTTFFWKAYFFKANHWDFGAFEQQFQKYHMEDPCIGNTATMSHFPWPIPKVSCLILVHIVGQIQVRSTKHVFLAQSRMHLLGPSFQGQIHSSINPSVHLYLMVQMCKNKMDVSWKGGTRKSSILIGFSI